MHKKDTRLKASVYGNCIGVKILENVYEATMVKDDGKFKSRQFF